MTNPEDLKPSVAPHPLELPLQRWEGHMSDDVAATFGPEPMAFLSATRDEIVLSGTRGTYRLSRSNIVKIRRGKMYPWFFSGVRLQHRVEGFPSTLQFQPSKQHWREVAQALRELGYPCS